MTHDDDTIIAKAIAALKESVGLIMDSAEDAVTKREELAETFDQFASYLDRNHVEIEKVAKAAKEVGQHSLAAALVQHLQDRLERRRERHGYTKRKESAMPDTIHSIMKDGGIAGVCAAIVQKRATTITEHELVEAVGKVARERHPELSEAQAFARVYSARTDEARVLQDALRISKAGEFVAVGPAGGAYEMPRSVAKADPPAPNADSAYTELMRKAEAYRDAHPNLSISQCFEKIYTDRANIELAKRERIESAPR